MYKHILIATDGSKLADKGLAHGLALARELGATVTIVTVTGLWSAFEVAGEVKRGRPNPIEEFEKAAAAAARKILDAAQEKARAEDVAVETLHVPDMHPADGIIDAAEKNGCDLIVMASHGRRGVGRLLLGSQATEVLTHSTIPTLIVR